MVLLVGVAVRVAGSPHALGSANLNWFDTAFKKSRTGVI